MPDYNPLFDPAARAGSITGFLGGMMGSPTQEQSQGGAQGAAVKEITTMMQAGKTPQEATMAFFQTPAGQDFFANAGPDGVKGLANALSTTINPAPVNTLMQPGASLLQTDARTGAPVRQMDNPQTFAPTVMKPGETAIDRNGKQIAQNNNPDVTNDIKNFKYFTDVAQLPPEQVRQLAALQMDPNAKENGMKERSIDEMVQKFGLDPQTALGLKAGTIQIHEMKNDYGAGIGKFGIINMARPQDGFRLLSPGSGTAPVAGAPQVSTTAADGTTPATGASAGVLPAARPTDMQPTLTEGNKNFGNKASMFLGAGAVPHIMGLASNLSEQVDAGNIIPEGAQATDRQNLINSLRSSVAAMGQMGEGISVNKGTIDGYLKMAPSGHASETPYEGVQKAIRLHEKVVQEITAEQEAAKDQTKPLETRKNAEKRIDGWSRVLRDLPTEGELRTMEKAIREGKAGAMDVAGGAKALIDAGGKTIENLTKQGQKIQKDTGVGGVDFKSMDATGLIAVDPRTLSREETIKYLRRMDQLKKTTGPRTENDQTPYKVAGDVMQFPKEASTIAPNSVGANNRISTSRGAGPGGNVIRFPDKSRG